MEAALTKQPELIMRHWTLYTESFGFAATEARQVVNVLHHKGKRFQIGNKTQEMREQRDSFIFDMSMDISRNLA